MCSYFQYQNNIYMWDYLLYIAVGIIILYYLIQFLIEEHINVSDPICKRIYIDRNNTDYTIIPQLFSAEECETILSEGIGYAKKNNWTLKRHADYPTTDNQITFNWDCYELLNEKLDKIYSEIVSMYSVYKKDLVLSEMFIAKYEPSKQSYLRTHVDGSEFSFIVALNDDYEGGGTYFTKLKTLVKLKKGDCLVFSGQNRHRGERTTKGRRFIVTGFINYKNANFCCYNYSDILAEYI